MLNQALQGTLECNIKDKEYKASLQFGLSLLVSVQIERRGNEVSGSGVLPSYFEYNPEITRDAVRDLS